MIIKMDLDTARFLCDDFLDKDENGIELIVCPECGAAYYAKLEHSCDNTIDVVTEEDKKKSN